MGRPSFQPTAEQRETVAALTQARVSQEEIARRLGITKKTLQKHFPVELGRAKTGEATQEKTGDEVKTPPPFQSTAEQRELVEILAAAGMADQQIADRIGVTPEMLKHHFADELRFGPGKRNADVIEAIYRGAKAGNQSAQRLWQSIALPTGAGKVKPPKPTLAGKKAEAQAAAMTAGDGTDWGDDLNIPSEGRLN